MSKDTPGVTPRGAIAFDMRRSARKLKVAIDRALAQPPTVPLCPSHPGQRLVCPACAGAWGGRVTSDKKARASRANGKKGGRPRKKRRGESG